MVCPFPTTVMPEGGDVETPGAVLLGVDPDAGVVGDGDELVDDGALDHGVPADGDPSMRTDSDTWAQESRRTLGETIDFSTSAPETTVPWLMMEFTACP